MNLNQYYTNCFWTASGELDCQSATQPMDVYSDHAYHVPMTGTQYLTHDVAQINQNLGYVGRTCKAPAQPMPFGPALTNFNLPRSAQPNSYQDHLVRQPSYNSGWNYPDPSPNCVSCYMGQDNQQLLPYGNQPSAYLDSEAHYNYGWGLPVEQISEPLPTSANGWESQYESVDFSLTEPVMGPVQPIFQLPSSPMSQFGGSYGQPLASQPQSMYTNSLINYKTPSLIRDLGNPDVVDNMLGGIAIWKEHTLRDKLGGIFKRVELHDEKVPNLNPPYIGNVYSWVKMNLKNHIFRDILDLFPNVWYDRQKRWLTVRTDTLDNNLATIALICLINRGTLSVRQVRHYDLQRKYMMSLNPQSRHFNRYSRATFVKIIKKCCLR